MKNVKGFLVLCVLHLASAENSPVFLWGIKSNAKPALSTLTQSDFIAQVDYHLVNKTMIVFVEDDLINKDFLCEIESKSCFAFLQGIDHKNYYASVQNPVEALKSLGENYETITLDTNNPVNNLKHLVKKTKMIFIKFRNDDNDNAIDRASIIKEHDYIIAEIYNELKEDAFYVYTTAPFNKIRQRRDIAPGGFIFRDGANILLYFQSLTYTDGKTQTNLQVTGMTVNMVNKTSMSVTLTNNSTKPLTFSLRLSQGYFYMSSLHYGDLEFRPVDIFAPTTFSYYCGNLTLRTKEANSAVLKWNGLQFQAPFGAIKDANFKFGDAWHCVGFFSGAILMGLLIVALLLTILFTGICWMKDINTMDRFDDPKGKTITISATE